MRTILSIALLVAATNVLAQWQPPSATDTDPITHSGNVAVGTTTPQTDPLYPLKVFGGGSHKGVRVQTTTDHAAFFETNSNGACTTRLQSNSTTGFAGTITNHPFLFVVNGTERARFDTTGYFSVGLAAPPISSIQQYTNTSANPITAALSGSGGWDGLLTLNASAVGQAGSGGGIVFGGNGYWQYFGAIKALLTNGSVNTTGDIAFSTRGTVNDSGLTERMRILAAGNVAVGTSTPTAASALTVGAPSDARFDVVSQTAGYATVRLVSNNAVYASIDSMDAAYTTPKHLLLQPNGGQLLIGGQIAGHAEKLVVAGDAYFSGTVRGANIQAQYQDIAEWVPASEDLAPGTVVVVDSEARNRVSASTEPYDTRVAGVVSAEPGIVLGVEDRSKAKIATTGRVRVRADARRNPIRAGDLLVSGNKPGTAMHSEPMEINGRRFHQPGTIIGKALEPLESGEGEILVLLSLQ